jgi:transcriptional regulator with XRE-family HTH domain
MRVPPTSLATPSLSELLAIRHNLPLGWRHPVTGRREQDLDPLLVRAGAHMRRARYMTGRSQQSLADAAGVSQSLISRFERALAPSMNADKLVRIDELLDRNFPIGYCPHVHGCPWQPIPMPSLPVGVGPARDPDYARLWAAYEEALRHEPGVEDSEAATLLDSPEPGGAADDPLGLRTGVKLRIP